jgi:PEP-CTERM motif/Dockerin type I domain
LGGLFSLRVEFFALRQVGPWQITDRKTAWLLLCVVALGVTARRARERRQRCFAAPKIDNPGWPPMSHARLRIALAICFLLVFAAYRAPRAKAQLLTIGPAPVATATYNPGTLYFHSGNIAPPEETPGNIEIWAAPPPGNPPATAGAYVVDAVSSGKDAGNAYLFSVGNSATGLPGSAVAHEVTVGTAPSHVYPNPQTGATPPEASGDIFAVGGQKTFGIPQAIDNTYPLPPIYVGPPKLLVDEYALALNVSGPGGGRDNLNGLAVRFPSSSPGGVLYSLAAGGTGPGPFRPGDIINAATGTVWATSVALGLDSLGLGTDDLDALIVQDRGTLGVYDAADFVAFSLAPGSASLAHIAGASSGGGDVLLPRPFGAGGGFPSLFLAASIFGLTATDNLDAIDVIKTTYPPGDVNFDGVVNIFDINLVSANWNGPGPAGDANFDGIVNIFDINLISANWGAGSSALAVPEPSSFVLLMLGLGATVRRRRPS